MKVSIVNKHLEASLLDSDFATLLLDELNCKLQTKLTMQEGTPAGCSSLETH